MRLQGIEGYEVTSSNRAGRLLRFLFNPPPLAPLPVAWQFSLRLGTLPLNGFAKRLAKSPPDLINHLGMVRSAAYFAAGCPLDLCDHAAARDLWWVIHQDAISASRTGHLETGREMEVLCR